MSDDKRQQFGNRLLNDESKVFEHNSWDRIDWNKEQENQALEQIQKQIDNAGDAVAERYACATSNLAENWDKFYSNHENKFFKDRAWLFTEFKDLDPKENPNQTVLEIGMGNGSNILPLIESSKDMPHYKLFGCDFAAKSVEIVAENDLVKSAGDRVHVFQHDISSDESFPIEDGTVDSVILTFVLSALAKEKFEFAIKKISKLLKSGGRIYFRDYGRFDMAQLRFKPQRVVGDNMYTRGDGTLVYFFTDEEVEGIFLAANLEKEQVWVDRRLQVNRAKRLKMYRIWIQSIFKKP